MNAGNDILPLRPDGWSEPAETKRQLGRFLIVGLLCVAVDLGFYLALTGLANWSVDGAKACSYLAGVVVGFVLNKLYTFRSQRMSLAEPLTYLALYAVTLGVNVGVNRGVLFVLGSIASPLAFLAATGVTTVLNFLGMRLVTFRQGVAERRTAALESKRSAA